MNALDNTLLIVLRHSPYGGSLARSGLDIALAAGAFEQPVCVLFCGAGVLQLAPGQDGGAIGRKTHAKQLAALPLYDIDQCYADAQALHDYNIDTDQAPMPVTPLDDAAIHALLCRHRHVLGI